MRRARLGTVLLDLLPGRQPAEVLEPAAQVFALAAALVDDQCYCFVLADEEIDHSGDRHEPVDLSRSGAGQLDPHDSLQKVKRAPVGQQPGAGGLAPTGGVGEAGGVPGRVSQRVGANLDAEPPPPNVQLRGAHWTIPSLTETGLCGFNRLQVDATR